MSAIGTSGLFIVVVERRLAERSGQFRLVNDWGVSLDKSRLIRLHQQMKEGIAVSFAGTGVHNNKAKASTFGSTPPRLQAFIGGPSNGPWARSMLSQKERPHVEWILLPGASIPDSRSSGDPQIVSFVRSEASVIEALQARHWTLSGLWQVGSDTLSHIPPVPDNEALPFPAYSSSTFIGIISISNLATLLRLNCDCNCLCLPDYRICHSWTAPSKPRRRSASSSPLINPPTSAPTFPRVP